MQGRTRLKALKAAAVAAALSSALLISGCGRTSSGVAVPQIAQGGSGLTPSERLNALPGERLNALPGLPTTGTLAERLNALPGQPQQLCVTPARGSGKGGCQVQGRSDLAPKSDPNTSYATIWGYKPDDLASAYGIPRWLGAGRTVAIVDAFDDPNIESDLAVYRSAMMLPPCTTANGCFTKLGAGESNQGDGETVGTGAIPQADSGWSAEIALDTEMVSAICPYCKILLVEAKSDDIKDLAAAEDIAASYSPAAISNSFYAPEAQSEKHLARSFRHPGIPITAAAGDGGYGASFPASVPEVTAVGGTTLLPYNLDKRGWGEGVWSGTGSGCSMMMSKPSWQRDSGCRNRTIADVAMIADPRTGVAMYTSLAPTGQPTGWVVGGGTSVGAPIVAAMYALAGSKDYSGPRKLWEKPKELNQVSLGSNGICLPLYLCTAMPSGYSGPAGNGTPNGLGAF